jgi:hypothetical protein
MWCNGLTGNAQSTFIINTAYTLHTDVDVQKVQLQVLVDDCWRCGRAFEATSKSGEHVKCDKCDADRPYETTTKFKTFPEVLVLHLEQKKSLTLVVVPMQIKVQESESYELYAVVSHKGASRNGGHYVAHVKVRDEWHRCDDDEVSFCNARDMKRLLQESRTDQAGEFRPYILFYSKLKISEANEKTDPLSTPSPSTPSPSTPSAKRRKKTDPPSTPSPSTPSPSIPFKEMLKGIQLYHQSAFSRFEEGHQQIITQFFPKMANILLMNTPRQILDGEEFSQQLELLSKEEEKALYQAMIQTSIKQSLSAGKNSNFTCSCGQTFSTQAALNGHQGQCILKFSTQTPTPSAESQLNSPGSAQKKNGAARKRLGSPFLNANQATLGHPGGF